MPDPATLTAALTSVKTAFEIAKLVRESGTSLQRAELNLRLAEIVSALADAKVELVQAQETLAARDAKILELEDAFALRGTAVRVFDAMYATGPNGGAMGAPHCLRCWEVDHRLRPLSTAAVNRHIRECHVCRATYSNMRTQHYVSEQSASPAPPD